MVSIRGYKPSDYEEVKSLYQTPETFGGQFDGDRDSGVRMTQQIDADKDSILIAEENGRIVGTVSILQNQRFAWLIRFAVLGNRKDVTEALFQEASENLKQKGHTQVLVYAPTDDVGIIKRYEDLGFISGKPYTAFWKVLD